MKLTLGLVALAGMFVFATRLNRYWLENPITPQSMLEGVPTQEIYLIVALAVCIVIVVYLAVDEFKRGRKRRL